MQTSSKQENAVEIEEMKRRKQKTKNKNKNKANHSTCGITSEELATAL